MAASCTRLTSRTSRSVCIRCPSSEDATGWSRTGPVDTKALPRRSTWWPCATGNQEAPGQAAGGARMAPAGPLRRGPESPGSRPPGTATSGCRSTASCGWAPECEGRRPRAGEPMKHRTIALSWVVLAFTAHAADLSGNFISEENPALRLALKQSADGHVFGDFSSWAGIVAVEARPAGEELRGTMHGVDGTFELGLRADGEGILVRFASP